MTTQVEDANGMANPNAKSNAFGVVAKGIKNNKSEVMSVFHKHRDAEMEADRLREKFKTKPVRFVVATGFSKCEWCEENSTDDDFLVKDQRTGCKICRRCDNSPREPLGGW